MAKRSQMTGAKGINAAFRNIKSGLNVPLNEASRKALRPTLAASKANLRANGNVETGDLLSTLSIIRDTTAPADKPTHAVAPDASKSPGYRKAHLIEFGVSPHMINGHIHPGHAASPFMRPAFEATKAAVIKIFGDSIGPAIERRARNVAKRNAK